jgi:hypothetical protein
MRISHEAIHQALYVQGRRNDQAALDAEREDVARLATSEVALAKRSNHETSWDTSLGISGCLTVGTDHL